MIALCLLVGASSPVLLKDIQEASATASSQIYASAELDGELIFSAQTPELGNELYVTDGTAVGTRLIKDIMPGPSHGNPTDLVRFGNDIYFTAEGPQTGRELWRTDGTSVGTVLVADIVPGPDSSAPYLPVVFGSHLYFTVNAGDGSSAIWRTDGANTELYFDPIAGFYAVYFGAGSDHLYMLVQQGVDPATLWYTNGVAAPQALGGPTLTGPIFVTGDSAFVIGSSASTGKEVFRSVAGGALEALEVIVGPGDSIGDSAVGVFAVANDRFYFACQSSDEAALCVADATTFQVIDPYPGDNMSFGTLTALDGALFLSGAVGPSGSEPCVVRAATPSTVEMIADIHPSGSGGPHNVVAAGARAFFQASNGLKIGWYATNAALDQVVDITSAYSVQLSTALFRPYGDRVIYMRDVDVAIGKEPWISDGTTAGSALLSNLAPDALSSSPTNFVSVGDAVLFSAIEAGVGTELFVTRGDEATTQLLADLTPAGDTLLRAIGSTATTAYLHHEGGDYGLYAYRSDGGLQRLAGPSGALEYDSGTGVVSGDALYFIGWYEDDPANILTFRAVGFDLQPLEIPDGVTLSATWAAAGRILAIDYGTGNGAEIFELSGDNFISVALVPGSIDPSSFTGLGSDIVFVAEGANGEEPYLLTGNNTIEALGELNAGSGSSPRGFTTLGDHLMVFSAEDGIHGRELWRTDGTGAGTVLLKDIELGPTSAIIQSRPQTLRNDAFPMAVVGTRAVFPAYQSTTGVELWVTDGTAAGTTLLRDIAPGTGSSEPADFLEWPELDRVLFTATSSTGLDLWMTDGTAEGTVQLTSFGDARIAPGNMFVHGSRVYFAATTSVGREPHFIDFSFDLALSASIEPPSCASPSLVNLTLTDVGADKAGRATLTVTGLSQVPELVDAPECEVVGSEIHCVIGSLALEKTLQFSVAGAHNAVARVVFGADSNTENNELALVIAEPTCSTSPPAPAGDEPVAGTIGDGEAGNEAGHEASETQPPITKTGCGCSASVLDPTPALAVLLLLVRRLGVRRRR